MKKMTVSFCTIICLFLTGCSSITYSQGVKAYNQEDYELAIQKFEECGDYKASKKKEINAINDYIEELEDKENYDKAIYIIDEYADFDDFSSLREELTEKKQEQKKLEDMESKYKMAISKLEKGNFEDGIAILKKISEESKQYEKTNSILDSYEKLKNSPFIGKYSMTYEDEYNPGLHTADIDISLDFQYDEFVLHLYKAIKSDGDIILDKSYDISPSKINGNSIKYGDYTWTMSGGTLEEKDHGEINYYY